MDGRMEGCVSLYISMSVYIYIYIYLILSVALSFSLCMYTRGDLYPNCHHRLAFRQLPTIMVDLAF